MACGISAKDFWLRSEHEAQVLPRLGIKRIVLNSAEHIAIQIFIRAYLRSFADFLTK